MLNPVRVDAAVDLAYGGLILLAIALIATFEFGIGIAFGLGVFSAYVLHVVWKMARFDPDWMTAALEETVEDAVDDSVGRAVDDTVERAVDDSVERVVDDSLEEAMGVKVEQQVDETIGDQLDTVQEQVEAVDDRLEGRHRSDGSESAATDSGTDGGE